jgi:hypothetical protein
MMIIIECIYYKLSFYNVLVEIVVNYYFSNLEINLKFDLSQKIIKKFIYESKKLIAYN